MNYNEIRRLNELLKTLKQLKDLRQILDQIRDIQQRNEAIRHFIEERKDQFWREGKPSEPELENLREQAGYDKDTWAEIVRELLGEKPPRESH